MRRGPGSPRVKYIRSCRIENVLRKIVDSLDLWYVKPGRVYAAVSFGSRTSAYARIWGLPGPFVRLGICEAMYVVELVYENVQGLGCERLLGVLIHELLHIPRSFSGGLRSHGEWSRWSSIRRLVEKIPGGEREALCREAMRGLEEARERAVGGYRDKRGAASPSCD